MQQIPPFTYECPDCKGALFFIGIEDINIHYDTEVNINTVFCNTEIDTNVDVNTLFSCHNCSKYYYAIESSYVNNVKYRQYCQFCNYSLAHDWSDNYKCLKCKSEFIQSRSSSYDSISIHLKISDKLYILIQYPSLKKSRIEIINLIDNNIFLFGKTFDFLMPNITPFNVSNKLPIYLLFS